jgi:hypothetical protein
MTDRQLPAAASPYEWYRYVRPSETNRVALVKYLWRASDPDDLIYPRGRAVR